MWRWLVAAATGCYAPGLDYDNGQLACAPNRECPPGFHCASDDRCWRPGDDPPDAQPADAPFQELLVTRQGSGHGALSAPGLECAGDACRGEYPPGTRVTIEARTSNGAESYFQRWGGDCQGTLGRDCTLVLDRSRGVTATFAAQDFNLVFVSSQKVDGLLGGLAPYDAKCNELASATGINNFTSTGFIAWMSTEGEDARDRLRNELAASRSGFVRMDGEPVASQLQSALFPFFYPADLNERGELVGPSTARWVWTGTASSGTSTASTCGGWTDTPGKMGRLGHVGGGPSLWTDGGLDAPCGTTAPIRCVGRTRDRLLPSLPAVPAAAKYVFVSPAVPSGQGIGGFDAACATAAEGVFVGRTFRAMVATTSVAASARVDRAAAYFRPDGAFVGSGADLVGGEPLRTGIWQTASGGYVAAPPDRAWTGSSLPAEVGTAESTCADWASLAGSARQGRVTDAHFYWREADTPVAVCGEMARVYCVEP